MNVFDRGLSPVWSISVNGAGRDEQGYSVGIDQASTHVKYTDEFALKETCLSMKDFKIYG